MWVEGEGSSARGMTFQQDHCEAAVNLTASTIAVRVTLLSVVVDSCLETLVI